MFKKIVEFFSGKKPEVALEAPYKVETPVIEAAPAPVAASVLDTVVITPEAVAPTLVADTIIIKSVSADEPTTAPVAAMTAKPKTAKQPAKTKTVTKTSPVTVPVKKPRKPRSK